MCIYARVCCGWVYVCGSKRKDVCTHMSADGFPRTPHHTALPYVPPGPPAGSARSGSTTPTDTRSRPKYTHLHTHTHIDLPPAPPGASARSGSTPPSGTPPRSRRPRRRRRASPGGSVRLASPPPRSRACRLFVLCGCWGGVDGLG